MAKGLSTEVPKIQSEMDGNFKDPKLWIQI